MNYRLSTADCLDAFSVWKRREPQEKHHCVSFVAGFNAAKGVIDEQHQTIAMLSQQLADKKEIIRRLTT